MHAVAIRYAARILAETGADFGIRGDGEWALGWRNARGVGGV